MNSCRDVGESEPSTLHQFSFSENVLDYKGAPNSPRDRDMLMFSDQGAWFAYGLPDTIGYHGGFSGPFLMTQENGVWLSPVLQRLEFNLIDPGKQPSSLTNALISQKSYASHLEQVYVGSVLNVKQELVYLSAHTALQRTVVTNRTDKSISLDAQYSGQLFDVGVQAETKGDQIALISEKSDAVGYLLFLDGAKGIQIQDGLSYNLEKHRFVLKPQESKSFLASQTFIFPEYSWEKEKRAIEAISFDTLLKRRKVEAQKELLSLQSKLREKFNDSLYLTLAAKARLTMQNNWRVPAGELKHQGLFPSYHYEWFHGFWSWDSWKHAAGLSLYHPELAKDQIRAMFDFQHENGFIVDCVYRDTTIEAHNLRDTKPPLAAWAVAKITQHSSDTSFVKEMYPKLKKYHRWWYLDRDHDQDGLCEYGSTDGTLIAAKWESGMDNAIRFDGAKMLKNSERAFSMNQESVDLNSYLYAEKLYLAKLAAFLHLEDESKNWTDEAHVLKERIQKQFFSEKDGWFYDTNLKGDVFVEGAGSEGWIPLWAKVASSEQAKEVKDKMMDPMKFYVKVPFQTMAADHPKFNPLKGYWRGPNWLDQAYFGIKGLRNYGFEEEADVATIKLLEGAEGILDKGTPIFENYHPLTGKGLNAPNFSWSAAHILMLLTNEE